MSIESKLRFTIHELLCLLIATLFIVSGEYSHAADPDKRLYSENADERFSAYQDKTQRLTEALAAAKSEKSKNRILLQLELLEKLKEFSDNSDKSMPDFGLPKSVGQTAITWQHFDMYVERYAEIIRESRKSGVDLGTAIRQLEEISNTLIALDQKHPNISVLQLQHAIQVRKLDHLKEVDGYLKRVLSKAKEEFYPVLQRTIPIHRQSLEKQGYLVDKEIMELERLREKTHEESTGTNVEIQKQESLLASYLGQELSDDETRTMHFEQLKLIDLQLEQVLASNRIHKATIQSLVEEQKLIWFRLLGRYPDFFKLADMSGDVTNRVRSLREKIIHRQELTHSYEKDVSSLGGGNAILGPKAQELVVSLNQKVQSVFEQLSGMDQQAEMIVDKSILLDRAINLKQSALGSVVTKTKVATDDLYENIVRVLRYPIISYSGINVSLLLILQMLLLLVVGIIINHAYCLTIIRVGKKRSWSERTTHLVQAVGKYPFIFLVGMVLLSVVGINTRSLALVAGALSVGVGFGMQTIANNLVSGIILLFDKSISPGDFISLGDGLQKGGTRGNVVQMNIRATVLRTNDNINVIIPNADLIASQVVNWTYSDEKIRLRIPFSVTYGTNISKVKALVEKIVLGLSIVLSTPPPQVWLEKQANQSLHFLAAIWVEGQNARQPAKTTDTVLSAILNAFYSHDIEIPYQTMGGDFPENKHLQQVGTEVYEQSRFTLGRQLATQ